MSTGISIHKEFSESIRILWDNLNTQGVTSPFLNSFVRESWFNIFGSDYDLMILNHSDQLLMPLKVKNKSGSWVGSQDLFDLNDLIFQKEIKQSLLVDLIFFSFQKCDINRLDFFSIIQDSPLHKKLIEACRTLNFKFEATFEDVSPVIKLPKTWNDYLMSLTKKNRHEIRRKMRRLEEAGDINIETTNTQNLRERISTFFALMIENKEKKKFLTSDRKKFMSEIISDAIQNNYGDLNFLTVNGSYVATSFYFVQDSKISVYNSGFDQSFSELSVGLLNHVLNIKKRIDTFEEFDFLRGSENYKFRLGCESKNLIKIEIRE
ncbi:MAG: GNAT family N-acetyltransferase [Chloroflexota bacterium]